MWLLFLTSLFLFYKGVVGEDLRLWLLWTRLVEVLSSGTVLHSEDGDILIMYEDKTW